MKYILFLIITTNSFADICDREFPTQCHSQEEWDKIYKENWNLGECMKKQLKCYSFKCVENAAKKCDAKVSVEVNNGH